MKTLPLAGALMLAAVLAALYYRNERRDAERTIEATIWEPGA